MNYKKHEPHDAEGSLPALAPLANPYVPFQTEHPVKYEARKGLVRGTLYPGLDLPFMGMQNNKTLPVTPMSEMQALSFAIQELALYLDTHREDREALELYHQYQEMAKHCEKEYVKVYGPTNHKKSKDSNTYEWLNDPWPWEYAKNREG